MRFDERDRVVKAPDSRDFAVYKAVMAIVKKMKFKELLSGTKEEVLANAAKSKGTPLQDAC